MFVKKIFNGDDRTTLMLKNIAGSILVKGWNCIVQFLLVPITLNCLTQYEYGVWLTVNSILIWIDQFDIGLGNGLRNKLAEALAKNERERAKTLVSSTFIALFFIIIPIVFAFIGVLQIVDCYQFLKVDATIIPNMKGLLEVLVALMGGTFIFKFIGNIYLGLQLPAINNLLVVAGQTLSLAVIYILSVNGIHSLFAVAVVYTASPLVVYILSYPVTFCKYKFLTPSLRAFDKSELKGLFSLGVTFFFVQVAGLVIFASSNILITNLLSPSDVTLYQISYRYFSLLIMAFTLISAPLWSATTDAYAMGDVEWIRNVMEKMRRIMFAFAGCLMLMLLASPLFYKIWVGDKISITWTLSALMAVYVAVLIYSTCYSNVLFGIGKLRMITCVTVLEAIIYIPLAICLSYRWGLYGIVVALILVNLMCAVCNRIQYSMLMTGKASGIWNK